MSLQLARCLSTFRPATRRFASSLASHQARRTQRSFAWGAVALGVTAGSLVFSTTIYLDSQVTKTLTQENTKKDIVGKKCIEVELSLL